jgi:hypothetical protein
VPFAELPYALCGAENEAVGIYLRMQGQMSGQVMLEAEFVTEGRSVEANCWMIPDPAALEKLSRQDLGHGR